MKKILFSVSFACTAFLCIAQQVERDVISSLGGDHPSMQWTVGETVTAFLSTDYFYLSEGFHQASVIRVTAITEPDPNPYQVYPNPCLEGFHIAGSPDADYQLLTPDGRVILSQSHQHPESYVDLTQQTAGAYFLTLKHKGRTYQYQIIKTQP